MQFLIVSTSDALIALEDRWNELVARSPDSSVFQTYTWLATWWRFFGQDRALRVILAEDDGKLFGLLPVYIERSHLLPVIGLRKLRLIGYGGDTAPDDLGPILDGDHRQAALDALIEGLESLRPEWDIAEFDDLDPKSPLIEAMQTLRPGEVDLAEGASISYVDLPETFDEYLAELSSNRRWKIRRGRKKLLESTGYRCHVVASKAELDRHYPDLVRLHKDRWETRAEDIGFSTEGYVEFHRSVMADMLEQDCLRLMLLISDDGAIAANYCYRWRGNFYFFQGGFAKAYEPYRIGEVLMGHAIEQAIAEGMQVFDMLRGEHDYKKSLTDKVRTRTHLYLNQPTLRTRSYRALRACYRTM
ncbi:MAG: GNAT family N-acetyltransferase, partial [Geminicoccaceae bacterium]